MGEALNETAYGVGLAVRGSHWFVLGNRGTVPRSMAQRMAHPPILTIAPTEFSPDDYRQLFRMEVQNTSNLKPLSGLKTPIFFTHVLHFPPFFLPHLVNTYERSSSRKYQSSNIGTVGR